jgi:four helix bundle protein
MRAENVVLEKSFAFAVRIVKACQYLMSEKREFVLSKQLLRSGTSIGANIEEAVGGQSRADFASKIGIAYKEYRETNYWIRLLRETGYLTPKSAQSLLKDSIELQKVIASILIAVKAK